MTLGFVTWDFALLLRLCPAFEGALIDGDGHTLGLRLDMDGPLATALIRVSCKFS